MTGECELSVVVPSFQEGEHLCASVCTMLSYVDALDPDCEIIVVDDGSTDCTWAELTDLAREDPRVRGIRLSRNFGKDYAISAGLERARGRAVVVLDADLQHPPNDIARFYDVWKRGQADIVDGVKRNRRDEPTWRRAVSRAFNRFATWITGIDLQNSSDFKLLDRKVIEAWKELPERRCFFRGMVSWVGYRHATIEFDVRPRRFGSSRWGLLQLARLAARAVISYSAVPLRLVHLASVVFFAFALWLGIQALYLKMSGQAVDGFTTVIILILLLGSLLLLGMGVLGEYVAAIYEEMKSRPRYVITEELGMATDAERDSEQIQRLAQQIGTGASGDTRLTSPQT